MSITCWPSGFPWIPYLKTINAILCHLLRRWTSTGSMPFLVGGWALPVWKIWKSVWMIIPNIWKNKIHVPKHQPEIEWTTLDSFPSPSLPGHPPKNHSLPRCGRPRAPPGGRGAWDGRVVAHLRTVGNGKLFPMKWRNPTYPPSNYWVKGNSCWFGLIRFDGLLWWVISRDLTTVIR